jgi:hypothetical protein
LSVALKLNGVVHHSALGAAGKVNVGVIGVNVSTTSAAVDAIFTLAWLKATAAKLGIDSDSR